MRQSRLNLKQIAIFFLLSALALIVISFAFYPLAKFYLSFYPPPGNDFYHPFNLIAFYKNNLTWPQTSWRYIWHFGGPSIIAYPWLNFYLVQLLVKIGGMYYGSLYYFLGSLFLYGFVSYLLFYRLSKSFLVSLGLAVALIWSASTWRIIVAGSLALTVNQFFLVLALLLTTFYLESKNRKWLFSSSLAAGLSVWSQSGNAYPFLIPLVVILILFWWSDEEKFWQAKRKIADSALFLLLSLSLALPNFYYTLTNILGSRSSRQVFEWMKTEAFSSVLTKTNPGLLVLLFIFFLVALLFKATRSLKKMLPFCACLFYLILFNLLSVYGLNPFGASLAPAENWYILTLLIAFLVAILWQAGIQRVSHKWLYWAFLLLSFAILLAPFGFWQAKSLIKNFEDTNMVCGVRRQEAVHQALVKNDFSGLDENFPSWVDKDDNNFRFFSLSWCVDLWWNSFYKMPLTGGYDTLLINEILDDYLNWTNDIFSGTMAKKNLEPVVVKNNMFFHIDWLGGKYIEKIADDLPYFEDPEIIKLDREPEGYRIYEFKEDIISPIVRPTNVPAALIISSQEGYDSLLRVLAQENLNSRFLIPVKGSPYIDDLVKENLEDFEAIILYNYQYKKEKSFHQYPQKPWEKLASYVKNGGILIIETGSEVKESDLKNLPGIDKLPEVFPIDKTQREELGTIWQLSRQESKFLEGVDEANFSPLDYDGLPWKLSTGVQEGVRSWAKVVLSQKEKPILVWGKLGKGQVIWSGMTLPYHIQTYHNLSESKLFRNFFEKTLDIKEEAVLPFDFKREKSEHIGIAAANFTGIVFKENFNSGWQAKVGKVKLNIYPAGFGFMYVKIPKSLASNGERVIKIDYQGEPKFKKMFFISLTTIIFVIIYLFVGQKINLDRMLKFKKIKNWWSKENE